MKMNHFSIFKNKLAFFTFAALFFVSSSQVILAEETDKPEEKYPNSFVAAEKHPSLESAARALSLANALLAYMNDSGDNSFDLYIRSSITKESKYEMKILEELDKLESQKHDILKEIQESALNNFEIEINDFIENNPNPDTEDWNNVMSLAIKAESKNSITKLLSLDMDVNNRLGFDMAFKLYDLDMHDSVNEFISSGLDLPAQPLNELVQFNDELLYFDKDNLKKLKFLLKHKMDVSGDEGTKLINHLAKLYFNQKYKTRRYAFKIEQAIDLLKEHGAIQTYNPEAEESLRLKIKEDRIIEERIEHNKWCEEQQKQFKLNKLKELKQTAKYTAAALCTASVIYFAAKYFKNKS